MNELTGGTVCSVDAATGAAMGPSRTSRFNQEEQETRMYLTRLGMISALLIVGLLYGCGDSKQTRMVDFREKSYPADVASVSGISDHEPWGRWTVGARAVLQFKKTLPSTFQLTLQTKEAFGPNAGIPILVRVGSIQKEFTVAGPNELILLDFEGVANADRIEFVIPKPTSPKELAMSEDLRKLGLGLVSLAIGPKGGI
jgi:phosphoglycerol transferase